MKLDLITDLVVLRRPRERGPRRAIVAGRASFEARFRLRQSYGGRVAHTSRVSAIALIRDDGANSI
jgi:hypothetical protein